MDGQFDYFPFPHRPSNAREKAIRSMDMVEMPSNKEVVLRNNADTKLNKKFTFDRAFGPESKQVSAPHPISCCLFQRPFENDLCCPRP